MRIYTAYHLYQVATSGTGERKQGLGPPHGQYDLGARVEGLEALYRSIMQNVSSSWSRRRDAHNV